MSTHTAMTAFSESWVMPSAAAGVDYLVSVALPPGFEEHPDRRWPMIFVLDGNWHFGLVADMVRFMNIRIGFCDELPDTIVIGIGYPVAGTQLEHLHQVMHLRTRDFVLGREESGEQFMQDHFPIPNYPITSGNGFPFMGFLRDELSPTIEAQYRGDPEDRTLLGHSLGANFGLYTVFRHPGFFRRAVLASIDPLLNHEEEFARTHDDLPLRLHLVNEAHTAEDLAGFHALVDKLTSRRYPGLVLTTAEMSSTHCAMVPYAYQSGLVSVFTSG